MIGSLEKGLKTCGKPFCARTERKSANQEPACSGRARSTPWSTLEPRTSLPTVGRVVPASSPPISQATRSMATTLTTAPPVASSARAGVQVMWRRSLLPRWVVRAWPTEAQTMTMTTATTAAAVLTSASSVTASQRTGSSSTAASPPPRNPITDRMPMTNPWRYPTTANHTAAISSRMSSTFTESALSLVVPGHLVVAWKLLSGRHRITPPRPVGSVTRRRRARGLRHHGDAPRTRAHATGRNPPVAAPPSPCHACRSSVTCFVRSQGCSQPA